MSVNEIYKNIVKEVCSLDWIDTGVVVCMNTKKYAVVYEYVRDVGDVGDVGDVVCKNRVEYEVLMESG